MPAIHATRPESTDGRIVRVGADRLVEAIERLVAGPGEPPRESADRFIAYAGENAVPLDYVWSMLDRRGRTELTVIVVPSPGRTAMVFATHPSHAGHVTSLGRLIDHVCEALPSISIEIAQALVTPGDRQERDAFLRGGFFELADLSYMQRSVPPRRAAGASGEFPPVAWPEGADVRQYDESIRPEVLEALEASYEATLDCPALCGLRRTEDVLEGHLATGRFEPGLWTLLRVDARPAGVALLNPSPAHATIELVYLGLAAHARGRGLGTRLLTHAMRLISGRSERMINLAVDDGNAPAKSLYERAGFRAAIRRKAMIRALSRRDT